jgi:hypothetical protein
MVKLSMCPKLTKFGTQGSRLIFWNDILQITLITSQLFVSQCPFSYEWECLIESCMLQAIAGIGHFRKYLVITGNAEAIAGISFLPHMQVRA